MLKVLPYLVFGLISGLASAAPVKIGAVYANSGFLKPLDDASWRGTQAAAAVASRAGQRVELVYAPYDSTSASAAQAVRGVLKNHPDVAGFVGVSDTGVALSAGREAVRAGKVFVTSGATSPLLPRQLGSRFFLACFGDNVQAAAAAQWLRSAKKVSRVVVIYNSTQNYTRLLQRYFAAAFGQAGGKVTETMSYRPGEPVGLPRDLRSCEAIFLASASATEAGRVIAKLRAAGFKGPIVGGDGYDDPSYWNDEPLAENVFFTTHAYPAQGAGAASPATLSAFRGSYRGTPDAFGGLGFDALRVLLAADPAQGGDLAKRLSKIVPLAGVTGPIVYTGGSRVPLKPVALIAAERPRQMLTQITPSHVPAP
ncbi:MAG: ABC transporter substrate-binding protein [Chthoniobacterales bacterium]|nr:ABC transporter substrate-binding protein [Chthoniobacterales bacterium]